MKNIFALALATFTITSISAQNISDALRYGQTDLNGTARFRAMGGAFGALGGDFSSLNVNPAGSVIFTNNQVGATLSNFNIKNNSNYFGNKTTENNNSFDINQAGAVFVFQNGDNKSDWKKFAIAVNYENTNNFENSLFSAGTNQFNSIDNYFLSYANGVPFGNIESINYEALFFNEQQAYLGYNSYIIDPFTATNSNIDYFTNISEAGNNYQENTIESSGFNGKLSFNASTQYKDKFSIGINLNSHFLDYTQSTSFFESNNNPIYTTGSTVDRVRFNNQLYTYGTGFSFNIGTIFKPTKEVRLGFAYESPTWYKLNDELSQQVVTSGYGLNDAQDNTLYSTQITNPNVTMIFQPYKLQTPGKWTGSFAYIFGKKGLISVDYSLKDYSNMEFRPKNDFTLENRVISNLLSTSSEIRVGSEYKINKLSLRAGYRWEQSPYKNSNVIGDLTGYSGGFGYNFGATKVDLAYARSKRNYNLQFFSQGLVDTARIERITDNITLTFAFEL